ncbi:SRPBCC family protein [Bacillus songklensis]
MADLRDQIFIEKPLEEVFAFAVDLHNTPKVMVYVLSSEKITEGPIGVGTQFRERRKMGAQDTTSILEFIEYIPNRSYTIQSETNGIEVIYRYQFKTYDNGTLVDFTGEVVAKNMMMRFIRPMVINMLKKEDKDCLSLLKKAIEQREKINK